MSSNKTKEFKQFLISTRKRVTSGLTNAPVFAMQKKRSRIYNTKGRRNWRQIDMMDMFKKSTKKTKRNKGFKGTKRNAGKINPNTHRKHKKKD
jgi:ribosomal protein L39E